LIFLPPDASEYLQFSTQFHPARNRNHRPSKHIASQHITTSHHITPHHTTGHRIVQDVRGKRTVSHKLRPPLTPKSDTSAPTYLVVLLGIRTGCEGSKTLLSFGSHHVHPSVRPYSSYMPCLGRPELSCPLTPDIRCDTRWCCVVMRAWFGFPPIVSSRILVYSRVLVLCNVVGSFGLILYVDVHPNSFRAVCGNGSARACICACTCT
jgi:hypothetical protein